MIECSRIFKYISYLSGLNEFVYFLQTRQST